MRDNELLIKFLLEIFKKYELKEDIIKKILGYGSINLGIIQNRLALIREHIKIQKEIGQNHVAIVQKLQKIEQVYYTPLIHELVAKEDFTSLTYLYQLFSDLADLNLSIGYYSIESYQKSLRLLINRDFVFKKLYCLAGPHYKKNSDIRRIYNLIDGYLSAEAGGFKPAASPLKYYSDAAIFYQYQYSTKQKIIKSILNKNFTNYQLEVNPVHLDQINEITCSYLQEYPKLLQITQKMMSVILNQKTTIQSDLLQKETMLHKKILSNLRAAVQNKLSTIDKDYTKKQQKYQDDDILDDTSDLENTFPQECIEERLKSIYLEIANQMKSLVSEFYREAEKELGVPPCNYSVIGMGSMALNQMTPYSDLELAILTKNNRYKNDLTTHDYFRNLSHLVHFKVINLGETELPFSRFKIDLNIVKRAINFDLGGKTPLGRIDADKPYDLIRTIEEMIWYVRNEDNKIEHIDKNLPYILEKVCHIHGSTKLVDTYQNEVSRFLQQTSDKDSNLKNCQVRALKILKEGAVEINYLSVMKQNDVVHGISATNNSDLKLFVPIKFSHDIEPLNIKQEIYRLIDRGIYNLGLYFNVHANNIWETIDQLCSQGTISGAASKHLKLAANFALLLRLKVYSKYREQKEYVSPFLESQNINELFCLDYSDCMEDSLLFQFYYIYFPFYKSLCNFCNLPLQDKDFRLLSCYDNNNEIKGDIFFKIGQYDKAKDCYKKHSSQDHNVLGKLFMCYQHLGNYDEAEKVLKQHSPECPCYPTSLMELAALSMHQGNHALALERYNEVLEFSKQDSLFAAGIMTNIGCVYKNLREYARSLEHHHLALELRRKILGKQAHQAIADSLFNVGVLNYDLERYNEAIDYYNQSLQMRKVLPTAKFLSFDFFDVLYHIGLVYFKKESFTDALTNYQKALVIGESIHDNTKSGINKITECVTAILRVYQKVIPNRSEVVKFCEKYEDKIQKHYNGEPNIIWANIVENCGMVLSSLEEYQEAHKYFLLNLELRLKLVSKYDNGNSELASAYNCLGVINSKLEDHTESDKHYTKAYKIIKNCKSPFKETIYDNISWRLAADERLLKSWRDDISQDEELASILLINTIIKGNETTLSMLVNLALVNSANINKPDKVGTSPLYYSLGFAGQTVNLKIVKLLLENLANPNQTMCNGDSPMHIAHYKGSKQCIKLLLEKGSQLNAINTESKTPLHCLLASKKVKMSLKLEIIKEFSSKYDTKIQDKENKTVVDYANESCVEALELLGSVSNQADFLSIVD